MNTVYQTLKVRICLDLNMHESKLEYFLFTDELAFRHKTKVFC